MLNTKHQTLTLHKQFLTKILILLTLTACQSVAPALAVRNHSASTLALSPHNTHYATLNFVSQTLTLLHADDWSTRTEIALPAAPRTLAFNDDGTEVWVTTYLGESVALIDVNHARLSTVIPIKGFPYGIVVGPQSAYVTLFAFGQVIEIDRTTHMIKRTVDVAPFPAGLTLDASGLYVTHLYSGQLTRIDLPTFTLNAIYTTHADANLATSVVISGAQAYLPLTLSHSGLDSFSPSTAIESVVAVIDLSTHAVSFLPLGNVSLPLSAALDGATLYIANAGSDNVTALNVQTGAQTLLPAGHNPRGVWAHDGRVVVNNMLDGTLSEGARVVSVTTLPDVTGERLFNSALAPMGNDVIACASCHFDGGADARTWKAFPDGIRDTPALFGVRETLPIHWSGNLDELADVEATIRNIQGGAGLIAGDMYSALGAPNANRSTQLDVLVDYLKSLDPLPSPFTADAETIARGERALARWGCAQCHTNALLSDLKTHDIKELSDLSLERQGTNFDTPSLRGLWLTAPYFHDGTSATLRDTLFRTGMHGMGYAMNAQEIVDIVALLKTR